MRGKIATLMVVAGLAAPGVQAAETANFSFLEAAGTYSQLRIDGNREADGGFAVFGSGELGKYGFVRGDLRRLDYDDSGLELEQLSAGGGVKLDLYSPSNESATLYAGISYERVEAVFPTFGTQETGFGYFAGIRGRLGKIFELNAEARGMEYDISSGYALQASVLVLLGEHLGVVARYQYNGLEDAGDIDPDFEFETFDAGIRILF